ncbi:Gamma-glutamyltranspeptidase [Pikeienuella piscinae]|uniref:Gamma-glutamyltranspeptidase n=1 Tax=Pikeienuella piscinae TaxID=2748098 RepID=A0A7L5BWT2_9RHOB|nr:gamma-glutamyltransferase [Pikeienuella piscinae]QIE54334.1 Gamma-glutamyltranspeptidase [Pikeienuella piscinae]
MKPRAPFAVAAGHRLTAEAASEVLRADGNAVDAVIAGALTACVAEPALASLLGGGFLMVREPAGRVGLLDFFVQTPRRKTRPGEMDLRAVEADFGDARQVFHIGSASIATPGVARGLWSAHERLGLTPFAELAEFAVQLAKTGALLTDFQAEVFRIIAPIVSAGPAARALFCDGETPLKSGARYRNPELADVIETFAREGDRFFQEGEIAQALLSLDGGHLSALDLRRYQAIWREPMVERREPARLFLNPPPALGGALIAFALRLIRRGAAPVEVALSLDETARARMESGLDAEPSDGALRLLAPDLIERYRRELAGRRAALTGTTHISAIDRRGMGAALTLSNGAGSGMIAPGTGIMPNNMLGEEDLVGAKLTEWPCDQRLSSMMAPMTLELPDGSFVMLGSGGSNRIRSALAQVSAHILDRDMRLEAAISMPRLHVEKWPEADFEDRLGGDERRALIAAFPEARGWNGSSMFFGGVHAAARDAKGAVEAAGDERRDGAAITG